LAIIGALLQTVANGNDTILYAGLVLGILGIIVGVFGAWIPYMRTSSLNSGFEIIQFFSSIIQFFSSFEYFFFRPAVHLVFLE
jgi:hypothetical protein